MSEDECNKAAPSSGVALGDGCNRSAAKAECIGAAAGSGVTLGARCNRAAAGSGVGARGRVKGHSPPHLLYGPGLVDEVHRVNIQVLPAAGKVVLTL